jgi:hypothetical protein
MRIVKFKDGTFGIRRGIFNYYFYNFKGIPNWLTECSPRKGAAKTSEAEAREVFDEMTDHGVKI